MVKDVRPVIDSMKTTMIALSVFNNFDPGQGNISTLEALVTDTLDKDLGAIIAYAANAGDLELQAQLAQFANLVKLTKATIALMKVEEKVVATNGMQLEADNVPMISSMRCALSNFSSADSRTTDHLQEV